MTVGKEWKVILTFCLPLLFGFLIQHLYTIVDSIIVGQFLGEAALAALGTTVPLILLFMAFAFGLSLGCGVLIAQNFGAKRFENLRIAVSTSMILITGVGFVISALAFLSAPLLLRHVLQVPDTIFDMALLYLRIFSLSLFFQFAFNGVSGILRAVGDVKMPLYFLLFSSILNVILTLLAVGVWGWGIAGTAWTTVFSVLVAAVIAYVYMVRKYEFLRPQLRFDTYLCGVVLRIGIPMSVQNSVTAIAFIAMGRLVNSFGVISIASYTVATRIDGFAVMALLAFGNGITTFAGQNIGGGHLDRVKTGLRQTLLITWISSLTLIIILFALATPIVRLFGLEGEMLGRAVEQIRFVTPFHLLLAPSLIIGGMLKGAGDATFPMIATIIDLIVRVTLAYSLVHFSILGYNAAWVTIPLGWVLALALNAIRMRGGKWKEKSLVR